jgi:hypothetical protein
MSDLLHWYGRIHGPRAYRIVAAVRAGAADARGGVLERASAQRPTSDRDPAEARSTTAPVEKR